MTKRASLLVLMCLALVVTAACGGKADVETTPPPVQQQEETPPPPPPPPPREVVERPIPRETVETKPLTGDALVRELQGKMRAVYFDFDKSDLGSDARTTLQQNADVLQENPTIKVVVEGHCDERGTIEYNLALGERRAAAVRDYLGSLGIRGSRLRITSYGEEQPADRGKNESAYARNRRAEFRLEL